MSEALSVVLSRNGLCMLIGPAREDVPTNPRAAGLLKGTN